MNNQNEEQPQQPGMINCAQVIGKLPFWTRVVYFSMAGCWFLDLFTGISSSMIASSVSNTFWSYQIWTILTANLYVDTLFFMFIIIYNFNTFLPKLEERLSTSVLMLNFIINGALIQLITLCLQSVYYGQQDAMPLNGVEGIWFCMLFKYCYYNSEREVKLCCFRWKFKRMYYPYIMLAVCIILKFSIPCAMVVGLLYGLLQVTIQKFTTKISASTCYIKAKIIFGTSSVKCWIRHGEQSESEIYTEKRAYQNIQNFVGGGLAQNQSPDTNINKDPFANLQGVRLGDC